LKFSITTKIFIGMGLQNSPTHSIQKVSSQIAYN
jgi:hypothetical protein